MMATITNNDGLCLLVDNAKGRNRSLDVTAAEFRKVLKPNGVHLCNFEMLHEHVAGQRVEPHLRTWWMVAVLVEGELQMHDLWLDVDIELFNQVTAKLDMEEGEDDG